MPQYIFCIVLWNISSGELGRFDAVRVFFKLFLKSLPQSSEWSNVELPKQKNPLSTNTWHWHKNHIHHRVKWSMVERAYLYPLQALYLSKGFLAGKEDRGTYEPRCVSFRYQYRSRARLLNVASNARSPPNAGRACHAWSTNDYKMFEMAHWSRKVLRLRFFTTL